MGVIGQVVSDDAQVGTEERSKGQSGSLNPLVDKGREVVFWVSCLFCVHQEAGRRFVRGSERGCFYHLSQ